MSCGEDTARGWCVQNSNLNSGSRGLLARSSPGIGYFEQDGGGTELKNRLLRNVISGAFGKLNGARPPMLFP